MNDSQKQFIELLNAAIHKQKIDLNNKKFNWNEIIDEAKEHDVKGLIYSAINKSDAKIIGVDLYEQLKKDTLFGAIYQKNHINIISEVFNKFEKDNIDVIALKGLVIRNLYPNPDLRSMGDADILVKENELDKVRKILLNMGYIEGSSNDNHISFEKEGALEIEVHWTLSKKRCFKDISFFEENVWNNAIKTKVGNSNVLSMANNELLLHLCLHLASHATSGGFGVRQLSDIVLLVEKERLNIDWDKFLLDIDKWGIEKFTKVIFKICNRLFCLDIPERLKYNGKNINIDKFIQMIIQNGVHGKRSTLNKFSNGLAYQSENKEVYESKSKLTKYMEIIFPCKEQMELKYSYLKKSKVLLPVAWSHRIIKKGIGKEYSFKEKTDVIFKTVGLSKEKEEILNWLEL